MVEYKERERERFLKIERERGFEQRWRERGTFKNERARLREGQGETERQRDREGEREGGRVGERKRERERERDRKGGESIRTIHEKQRTCPSCIECLGTL